MVYTPLKNTPYNRYGARVKVQKNEHSKPNMQGYTYSIIIASYNFLYLINHCQNIASQV